MGAFALPFPCADIAALASRFPEVDESAYQTLGATARARGYYTREEFVAVCAWKTVRSRPRIAANSARAIEDATGRAIGGDHEAARMQALLELQGVGVPTASTLLHFAFPAEYPILDVRALDALGVKGRSVYPVGFWLEYLTACRALAARCGVSLRILDKALWQYSKERSARPAAPPPPRRPR